MSESDQVFAEIIALFVGALVVVVIFVCRRPRLAAVLVGFAAVWWALQVPGLVVAAIAAGAGLGVSGLLLPASFRRLVSAPLGRARRRGRYRRMWPALTAAHRLAWAPHPKTEAGRRESTWELLTHKPVAARLEAVEIGPWMDRLRVRMLPGQTPADWEDAAEGIAHAVGALDGRVRVTGPGRLTVELAHHDPLATVVTALRVPTMANLSAVPIGVAEDGSTWCVRLAGSHVLVAGVTGAGKGSVIWSLLRGLCPAIAAGTAQVWALDPLCRRLGYAGDFYGGGMSCRCRTWSVRIIRACLGR